MGHCEILWQHLILIQDITGHNLAQCRRSDVATLVVRMQRRGQLDPIAGRRAGHCAASVHTGLLWSLRSPQRQWQWQWLIVVDSG